MENEQQKQLMQSLQEKPSTQEVYTWSMSRVAEGIAINVGSAVVLAMLTLIIATVSAPMALLVQHIFRFLVIPTHWLVLIALVGFGMLLTLSVLYAVLYLLLRKVKPGIILGMLVGAAVGILLDTKNFKINLEDINFKTAPPKRQ